ncbi:response regulator transcription factor [Myceligenerans crystallogenes]|uniref:Response regulator transcription factor n=1 Tax=Myceligenerans crystallogenes TaxID=316335 RepID=A0ABN2NJ79_9MICO
MVSVPAPPAAPVRRAVVVDDEVPLARLVAGYLEREGFETREVHDGAAAVDVLREVDPDVVVLDLGLPGLGGIEVCRRLRTFSDCYVVMLTARADEIDTVVGLSVGADDYLTKPFRPRELMARIQAMLRRPRGTHPVQGAFPAAVPAIEIGPLRIDVAAREADLDGALVPLTRTEFDVLVALAARPGVALSRRAIVEAVWGADWFGDDHLVDVHVLHVRRKLGDSATAQRFVRTVRGVGYRIGDGS